MIYFCLANSESFRVVTVSGKFSPPYLRNGPILFELWDAHTGALLWEKDGIGHGRDWSHAYPRFSENGKYLVVYDGAWVEILNAYSAQSTGSVNAATIPRPPTALAIGNDGICLALARNDLEERGIGPGVLFEKSFLGGDTPKLILSRHAASVMFHFVTSLKIVSSWLAILTRMGEAR